MLAWLELFVVVISLLVLPLMRRVKMGKIFQEEFNQLRKTATNQHAEALVQSERRIHGCAARQRIFKYSTIAIYTVVAWLRERPY
jgi:hypothetical protein